MVSILSTDGSIGSQSCNPKERKLGAIKLDKLPGKWQHDLKPHVHMNKTNAWRGLGNTLRIGRLFEQAGTAGICHTQHVATLAVLNGNDVVVDLEYCSSPGLRQLIVLEHISAKQPQQGCRRAFPTQLNIHLTRSLRLRRACTQKRTRHHHNSRAGTRFHQAYLRTKAPATTYPKVTRGRVLRYLLRNKNQRIYAITTWSNILPYHGTIGVAGIGERSFQAHGGVHAVG